MTCKVCARDFSANQPVCNQCAELIAEVCRIRFELDRPITEEQATTIIQKALLDTIHEGRSNIAHHLCTECDSPIETVYTCLTCDSHLCSRECLEAHTRNQFKTRYSNIKVP